MTDCETDTVEWAAGGGEWADAAARKRYLSARRETQDHVRSAVDSSGFGGQVSGSWVRGDFHMDRNGRSRSDLDLRLAGHRDSELADAAHEVEAALERGGVILSVSVHPGDSFGRMPLADQHYFNLTELILARSGGPDALPIAKAVLMLSRADIAESAVDAGRRLGLGPAVRVKLGIDAELLHAKSIEARVRAFRVGDRPVGDWLHEPVAALRELDDHFAELQRTSGQWIYGRVRAKIAGALSSSEGMK